MLAGLLGVVRPRSVVIAVAAVLLGVAPASASWHLQGAGAGVAQAMTDFHAPSVTGATVAPVGVTASGGAVKPGGQFVVYANAVDVGVSGVAWVRTDVSGLHAGSTSVSLSACASACTIGGTTYTWSSAPITADAGLAQGTRTFGVWSADNAGNLGSTASYSAVVDSTNPSVTAAVVAMSAPATVGWVHHSGSYVVYANAADAGAPASGVATVTADVSSLTPGTTALALTACAGACTVNGVTYGYASAATTAGASIAAGSATVPVTATDAAANSASASATATIDNTAPAITAATVVNSVPSTVGFAKASAAYLVYANASDAGGITTLTADVGNLTAGQTALALTTCASACTVGGVTYAYKSASTTAGAAIVNGATPFTLTAIDKAANATTGPYSVTVDNAAPTSAAVVVNTLTNTPGWLKKGGAYVVYANVTDAGSGFSSATANVTNITAGQTAVALPACASSCTVGGVTYAYKSASLTAGAALAAGSVSFSVTATDVIANTGTTTFNVTVDNTAPAASASAVATTVTMVPGYLSKSSSYAVYTNATDAGGVYSVTADVSNLTTGQTTLALPACVSGCTVGGAGRGFSSAALTAKANLTAGSKTYTVTVTDLAGNAATSASQSVTVDNTLPTVAITFPTAAYNGGWLAGCGTAAVADVCGTATDATAGVAGVQVSLRKAGNLYWNPATSSFSSASEVLMPATLALPNWSLAAASAWFTNLTSYTMRAVSTDAAANTATTSTTFTFKP